LQLRGLFPTTLIALAMAAVCAVRASADSGRDVRAGQDPDRPSQEQSATLGEEDTIAGYQGLTTAEIRLVGITSEVDRKRVLELIPQKVGEPVDRELIRESIHKLHDTGRFADVRVEAERGQQGSVVLTFFTAPNFFVGDVIVSGTPGLPTAGQVAMPQSCNWESCSPLIRLSAL